MNESQLNKNRFTRIFSEKDPGSYEGCCSERNKLRTDSTSIHNAGCIQWDRYECHFPSPLWPGRLPLASHVHQIPHPPPTSESKNGRWPDGAVKMFVLHQEHSCLASWHTSHPFFPEKLGLRFFVELLPSTTKVRSDNQYRISSRSTRRQSKVHSRYTTELKIIWNSVDCQLSEKRYLKKKKLTKG